MARTKKVLTRAEAKAMALREGVEAEEEIILPVKKRSIYPFSPKF